MHPAVAVLILRIGVFGLFHPAELTVRPAPHQALIVDAGERHITLEGTRTLRLRLVSDSVEVRMGAERFLARSIHAAARDGEFVLSVPGKIERRFRGTLEVKATAGELVPVVSMDLETAVASVVAAESPPGAPLQALMAQAVAARSYYAASRHRHAAFDFCDTTHCQFLRYPPAKGAPATIAAARTRGLVLYYQGMVLAALYSAACGGHTSPLPNAAPGEYPYFTVECHSCKRQPRSGHGNGLCQTGAKAMAARGAAFREILGHYFPNTSLQKLRQPGGAE